MRVSAAYTDESGNYTVTADIRENNRSIHIISIVDSDYGGEAPLDDFSDEEMERIHLLLLREFDDLDSDNGDDYSDEEEGDDNRADY